MLKRFIPVAGLFALMLTFMVGCQDSPTTGPLSTSAVTAPEAPYTAYVVPDQSLTDASDVPSFDQVMNDPSFLAPIPGDPGRKDGPGHDSADHRDTTHRKPDTTKGGRGPGGDDTTHHEGADSNHHKRPDPPRHGGKDSVENHGGKDSVGNHGDDTTHRGPKPQDSLRLRPVNYERIIAQLKLTKDQDAQIRMCFRDLNDCTHSAAERYRHAVQDLRDSLQAALRAVRAAVDAGTITRDEAKARIDRLVAQYRRDAGALEAAYRQAVDTCRQEFERCVASHLTPEQLRVWLAQIGR